MNIDAILQIVAAHNKTTVSEVRREMEKAIIDAKDTPNFKSVFGNNIPTLEEFIEKGIDIIKDDKEGEV